MPESDLATRRGRRVKFTYVDPWQVVEQLAIGGVFRVDGRLPPDATLAGCWVDQDSYRIRLATHSNRFGLVVAGELVPYLPPIELVSLLPLPIDVDGLRLSPTDTFFAADREEHGANWTCSRCLSNRSVLELPVERTVPIVARYCRRCAG
jgi:hypothetical protein